jgi:hypothetical protein
MAEEPELDVGAEVDADTVVEPELDVGAEVDADAVVPEWEG